MNKDNKNTHKNYIQIDILEHLKNDDMFDDILKLLNDNNIKYNFVSNF